MDQIRKDTLFLRQNNIIDYSLLIGIHILDIETGSNKNNLEIPLNPLKNKYYSSFSPGIQVVSEQDKNNSNEMKIEDFKFKESRSVIEKRNNLKINLEDDDKNITDNSIYNMDIKFSENDSLGYHEIRKSTQLLDKHPFRDVIILFICSSMTGVLRVLPIKKFTSWEL
jgi:hypothetical protein